MTRVLLDTNVLIHREASKIVSEEIGYLYRWLDRLGYEKCVHPASAGEIEKHLDAQVRATFRLKLRAYNLLQTQAKPSLAIQAMLKNDKTENDKIDTLLLSEVVADRVDYLASEDKGVHRKANQLGISTRVFSIEEFLERLAAEHPTLVDYSVLAVRRTLFGDLDVRDTFFDSFRDNYAGALFDRWFNRKADEYAYICQEDNTLKAFLYLKLEGPGENPGEISPPFPPRRRLKIGTFKVDLNGYNLGERFLKVIFDNAILMGVDEVYVTIFDRSPDQRRLVSLLTSFGFEKWGAKSNQYGQEIVLVRDMSPSFNASDPQLTYPYMSASKRAFLVPIWPQYHTSLLPDSRLNNEEGGGFDENEPYRNAIRKIFVSGSLNRNAQPGDTIIFYRTGGLHKGVVTTIGVVQRIVSVRRNRGAFIETCRRRSVLTEPELDQFWARNRENPYVVEFLDSYSFKRRPNLKTLIDEGVIANVKSVPRGFEPISREQFGTILRLTESNIRLVVN
jgi:predicted nucleic acid-binding protein